MIRLFSRAWASSNASRSALGGDAATGAWACMLLTLAFASACSSESSSTPMAGPPTNDPDASYTAEEDASAPIDGSADAAPTLTGKCADTFGSALTEGFGRIDGIVYAVQKPSDTACVMPNDDHLIVQVLMNGAVYRMVLNVQSDRAIADIRVRLAAVPHALPAPTFAEGWHTGIELDYVTNFGVHSADAAFQPYELQALVDEVAKKLVVGAPVSVYATSGKGRPESAHLVHRHGNKDDGALVLDPSSASSTFLLFEFSSDTF